MSPDQHGTGHRAGLDVLTGAWAVQGFVPATYERLDGTPPGAETPPEQPADDPTVGECVVLQLPRRPDAGGAWSDGPPWRRGPQRRGPQRGRRAGSTR